MQIKRDYSRPFFSSRRNSGRGQLLLGYFLFLGLLGIVVWLQFGRLQLVALDAIGMAPTATPFASEYASRGYEAFLAGDMEEAAFLYEQAMRQQPDNLSYGYEYGRMLVELDRAQEAIAVADQMIAVGGSTDPRGHALKAWALVWEGDSAAAIPVAVSGLEINSNYAPLYAARARAYTNIGRWQQGIADGQKAVDIDPMDPDAHRAYAYALIWVGERERAIEQLEMAISLNPNFTPPYFELALNYLALNRDSMAIATYERVLSMEPRNERAFLRLCESYFKIGQNDQAQGYCEDALEIDGQYPQAHRQLGMVKYNRRNYEGAIESFNACVDSGGEEIQCWYLRGLAHYYLGQCDDAWAVLEDALKQVSDTSDNPRPADDPVVSAIREGLRLTTVSCARYSGRAVPTALPPTPIPPTPIGGF
ncbi:MAG: tetratricopeptide repeat protein [Chloroflexota bacterium]